LVREIKPNYFVVENVPGILTAKMESIVDSFKRRVKRAGYSIVEPIQTINALDFGVPQRRQRVVILGHKKELPAPSYSKFLRSAGEQSVAPTVWDAIGDLVKINEHESFYEQNVYDGRLGSCSDYARELRGETKVKGELLPARTVVELTGCQLVRHTRKTVKRFEKTEPGTTEAVSHFYRLVKTGVAPTLRAGSDSSRGLFTAARPIHPTLARCITTREAARLHSFPDWFQFHPKKCHAFRQIGNSVPPKMAKALAEGLKIIL
jgi:DNA (cytosine-5)-methyltransferase 1